MQPRGKRKSDRLELDEAYQPPPTTKRARTEVSEHVFDTFTLNHSCSAKETRSGSDSDSADSSASSSASSASTPAAAPRRSARAVSAPPVSRAMVQLFTDGFDRKNEAAIAAAIGGKKREVRQVRNSPNIYTIKVSHQRHSSCLVALD
jgi:hypothetical protein